MNKKDKAALLKEAKEWQANCYHPDNMTPARISLQEAHELIERLTAALESKGGGK